MLDRKKCVYSTNRDVKFLSKQSALYRVSESMLACLVIAALSLAGIGLSETSIPVHLSHDIGEENTPAAEEDIRLEDFFWTGSGDGPPEYIKKVHTGINKGKDVIVKTETIVATVYVDKTNDVDTICLDCVKDPTYLPFNYTTTDRRYWLLTVISGFFRPRDLPLLEDKLAKLYRIAFTRQQSRHLGIYNNSARFSSNSREKRFLENNQTVSIEASGPGLEINPNTTVFPSSSSKEFEDLDETKSNLSNKYVTEPVRKQEKSTSGKYSYPPRDDHQVRVLIHNLTLITEDDIQGWDEGTRIPENNDKRLSRPFANQTELIYSVFYNGSPVLATTAAEDMKLVTESEVENIMEKNVFMKAEPYLKEPQATPLVPATKSEKGGVFGVVSHNPILVAICSIAILVLIVLLIALLLMTKAKRRRSAEVKRLSSRQGLLIEHKLDTPRSVKDASIEASRGDLEREGVQNLGYERDQTLHRKNQSPSIDFPLPPRSRPSSSGTTTSDSSVYCPINRPNVDLQNMLDEKAAKLFEKKKRSVRVRTDQKSEPVYTTVGREKKPKLKPKRRYLSENRVGSIEAPQAQSSDTLESNDSSPGGYKDQYDGYETYNMSNNYHRNKILQNRVFTDKVYDTVNESITSPTQAINREIIKALQGEKSSESGSIGSYLSMGSVKSFPRNVLPEPLHRVLEPVSVTYYDNYEDTTLRTFKPLRQPKTTTLVSPKAEEPSSAAIQTVSHSDNPDPGVIGPIVWEIHKKNRLIHQPESTGSPMHDPAMSRNRYEGLVEGAIQLYSSPTETPKPTGSNNSSISRLRETRGKSAIVASDPYRLSRSNSDNRPLTAGLEKSHSNHSTQPPSPNSRAWGSGAPSPLVRPLSAGPFHRPEPPVVDVTRVLVSQSAEKNDLSAAPLIEAIQNELKKFKRENSQ